MHSTTQILNIMLKEFNLNPESLSSLQGNASGLADFRNSSVMRGYDVERSRAGCWIHQPRHIWEDWHDMPRHAASIKYHTSQKCDIF